jgi:hypothetical protein
MRKLILLAAIVLVVPGLALAAGKPGKPIGPGKSQHRHGNGASKVVYVLEGTLDAYQPATSTRDGSVTITVNSSNTLARTLRGQRLQLPVSKATKVVGKFALNDRVIVKVRAPKKTTPAAIVAALLRAKAWQVIDQAPAKQRLPGKPERPPTDRH